MILLYILILFQQGLTPSDLKIWMAKRNTHNGQKDSSQIGVRKTASIFELV